MTAIVNQLKAVAEFGDVVPACVVELCNRAATEIVRLEAQIVELLSAANAAMDRIHATQAKAVQHSEVSGSLMSQVPSS
jgi:hypothetical protein